MFPDRHLGRLSWRPLSFLAALAVSAISHCGPILFNVRQRTFMCQHRAEVAVLNPSAAYLAPIAVIHVFPPECQFGGTSVIDPAPACGVPNACLCATGRTRVRHVGSMPS